MSASSLDAGPALSRPRALLWLLTLAIGAFFVVTNVPRYLTFNEASYGPYLWPRAGFVLPHVIGGLIAIVLGPLQFWTTLRRQQPRIHRLTGRVYLGAIVIGSLAGMALAATSGVNLAYGAGLFCLGIAWLSTSAMALIAVKKRNFVQHQEWMIRSYVVTFAFVIFRIVVDGLAYLEIGDRTMNASTMAWACWTVPLLVTELTLQGRKVLAAR